ncbi:RNA polymerase sigma factor [Bacteroidota bacterium]
MKLFVNSDHNNLTDEKLIKECIEGNVTAFNEIMTKYQKYVGQVVYKILWNKEDTKDVVQETFIKVWKNIKSYNTKYKFTTWLYKIAVNCAYDKLRKRKRISEFETDINHESLYNRLGKDPNLIDQISNEELIQIIKNLSNDLSPIQKLVFTLIDLEKMKINECAEILEMNTNSIKANLSYARRNIRLKIANCI